MQRIDQRRGLLTSVLHVVDEGYNGGPSFIVQFEDPIARRMRVYQYLVPSLYVKSWRSSTNNFYETRWLSWRHYLKIEAIQIEQI
jgi:hypothetical protein